MSDPDNVRDGIVGLLTDELGAAIDDSDPEDGWLTAHVALRAVAWVLDGAGLGPADPRT